MQRKKIFFTFLIMALFSLNSCNISRQSDKPSVVVTLFPQYDMVNALAGDYVDITFVLSPGVQAHAYEPSPKQVISMLQADLLFYTSNFFEAWVGNFIASENSSHLTIVDLSQGIELISGHHEEEAGQEEEEFDPHYWISPANAIHMVLTIRDHLIAILPENATQITTRAATYIAALQTIDSQFYDLIARSLQDTIMYGGHYAFGYLSARYGIHYVSPYSGFSTDQEPMASQIIEMIDTMNTLNTAVIYAENLDGTTVANAIAQNHPDVLILTLYAGENLNPTQSEQNLGFVDLMLLNLEALKIGLQYQETGD